MKNKQGLTFCVVWKWNRGKPYQKLELTDAISACLVIWILSAEHLFKDAHVASEESLQILEGEKEEIPVCRTSIQQTLEITT